MELNAYIEQKHDDHLSDLYELLRIPSVSAQSQHKPDIERAAQWVADRLRRSGFAHVEIVPTRLHPLVYAESLNAPGKDTRFMLPSKTSTVKLPTRSGITSVVAIPVPPPQ